MMTLLLRALALLSLLCAPMAHAAPDRRGPLLLAAAIPANTATPPANLAIRS